MTEESVGAMLLLILQHCPDPKLHSMLIETLLPLRHQLYADLFLVIAYGPPNTKIPAAKLLFHYWPHLKNLSMNFKLTEHYDITSWQVPMCQRNKCINKTSRTMASKVMRKPPLFDIVMGGSIASPYCHTQLASFHTRLALLVMNTIQFTFPDVYAS